MEIHINQSINQSTVFFMEIHGSKSTNQSTNPLCFLWKFMNPNQSINQPIHCVLDGNPWIQSINQSIHCVLFSQLVFWFWLLHVNSQSGRSRPLRGPRPRVPADQHFVVQERTKTDTVSAVEKRPRQRAAPVDHPRLHGRRFRLVRLCCRQWGRRSPLLRTTYHRRYGHFTRFYFSPFIS